MVNPSQDYVQGFELKLGSRPMALTRIEADDPMDHNFPDDGRIAPVARLASSFLDAIESGHQRIPGFAEGLCVQVLLDAARRANRNQNWVDTRPEIWG